MDDFFQNGGHSDCSGNFNCSSKDPSPADLANHTIALTSFLIPGPSGGTVDQQRYFSTGFNRVVLGHIQKTLGFNWSLLPASNSVDAPVNGSWTGAGALLQTGTVDLSIDLSVLVPFRAQHFALLHPLFQNRVSLYFRQPPASAVRDIFIQPFAPGLWLTLIGHLIVAWLVLMSIKYSRKRYAGKFPNCVAGTGNDIHELEENSFLWLTSLITSQGWYRRPDGSCLQITCLVGSCAGLILNISYSANLVSMLTLDEKPIANLAEFTASSVPLYASSSSDTIRDIFNGSLQRKKVKYVSQDDGYAFALSQPVTAFPSAYLTFSYRFFTESRTEPVCYRLDNFCSDITELEATAVPFRLSWILSKKSLPLREALNVRIVGLYTSGLLWRERKAYVDSYRPACDRVSGRSQQVVVGLTLADTFTAFFLLLIGVGLSFLVGAYEKFVGMG